MPLMNQIRGGGATKIIMVCFSAHDEESSADAKTCFSLVMIRYSAPPLCPGDRKKIRTGGKESVPDEKNPGHASGDAENNIKNLWKTSLPIL